MAHIKEQYRSKTPEQALAHLTEELAEALTAAAKGLRFGMTCVNPELPPAEQESNFDWLRRKVKDVARAYRELGRLLADAGHLPPGELDADLLPDGDCPPCQGTGEFSDGSGLCPDCLGSGRVPAKPKR